LPQGAVRGEKRAAIPQGQGHKQAVVDGDSMRGGQLEGLLGQGGAADEERQARKD